ncbi:PAS domain S-box protein [Sphingomonas morindae]|uniref:histidine kinase n=1 Tax=Sphingomonas morindae TaxID=1541170 RepID=A0ABY4X995_9SPHN|nr:PAS domain S-box protein [Sphingomonas morindae]USI73487.1 PAS domain S-box protein [Sphingomonas morindae]
MERDKPPPALALKDREPAFAAEEALAHHARFLEANLSAIPDYVYAFDRERRFAYANPAMLALFGLTAETMLGKTFAELDYPQDLATVLNGHIDQILAEGVTVQNEVFFRSPTGQAAYFAYLWGPVRNRAGEVELVVGVSRDTSERRAFEESLRTSEARLRAATELVGIGIYAWDPASGALEWDDRLRAMWGLPPGTPVDSAMFEAGIHPEDRARVQDAIARCVDPAGDGSYSIEYRVIGRDDGVIRHIATSGRTSFAGGKAVGFIGAAVDMTQQRAAEAAIRASEARFRGFADNSTNLIWIGDPAAGIITYRSAAYSRIWGVPCEAGPTDLATWMQDVHPEDRQQVDHALARVAAGEVVQFEYRLLRPRDGAVRRLRDTSFPIIDGAGAVTQIGGITEDLTRDEVRHVYVVNGKPAEARALAGWVRGLGYRAQSFASAAAFLDLAPALAPGCVLLDLRRKREEALSVPRELRARAITLPTIALDIAHADIGCAVAAMKAGTVDYILVGDEAALETALAEAIAACQGAARAAAPDDGAAARIARLTPRESEVLRGLVDGGTNKTIAQRLGISPRTVELHRAQLLHRLDAGSLTELLQLALAAGVAPSAGYPRKPA